MSKEAWKDTGNCGECRRRKFCGKRCKKNKEACIKAAYMAAREISEGRKKQEG